MKPNLTPEHYVALCSSENTDQLVRLNVHLRANEVDARFVSFSPVGPVIKVSPDEKERATELWNAWLTNPTPLLADYRKIKSARE